MYREDIFLGVNLYGIMIAVGLLACFAVLFLYSKIKNHDSRYTDFIFYDAIVSIALGFFSAALFQAFYNYLENPERGFRLGSGITFIGGLIGGVITFLAVFFIFRKFAHGKLSDILSIAPCCIVIAHAFGRIGCFFVGCCYGKETDSFLGVKFPHLSNPVHPTQLYEALFLFVLFAVLSYLLLKKDYKHNLSIYLIAYGVFRFLLEFVRDDPRGKLFDLMSPSQFWSIVMVIAGIALFFIMNYLSKKGDGKSLTQTKNE
ncbi:MAG: prolipoprotein diacylglyceryl transferase [Clostridia bacterium]|nr:prolipoprotein diacylglyceryl transferase [Clostridia bacterium]